MTSSRFHRALNAAICISCLSLGGCATVLGTAASPITGAVEWTADGGPTNLAPADFVLGAIAAPFVAFYNGVRYDAENLRKDGYWRDFHEVFRPFRRLDFDQRADREDDRRRELVGLGLR